MTIYWICYRNPELNYDPVFFPFLDRELRDNQLRKCVEEFGDKQITFGESLIENK